MAALRQSGLGEAVEDGLKNKPFFGICVGAQLLFEHSEEGDTDGLGWFKGRVKRFPANQTDANGGRLKVPHMGWNTVEVPEGSKMFKGLEDQRFYFVHSYGVRKWDLNTDSRIAPPLVTWSAHESDRFIAAVENGPLWATQFHPEKSGEAGLKLLQNWVDTL